MKAKLFSVYLNKTMLIKRHSVTVLSFSFIKNGQFRSHNTVTNLRKIILKESLIRKQIISYLKIIVALLWRWISVVQSSSSFVLSNFLYQIFNLLRSGNFWRGPFFIHIQFCVSVKILNKYWKDKKVPWNNCQKITCWLDTFSQNTPQFLWYPFHTFHF